MKRQHLSQTKNAIIAPHQPENQRDRSCPHPIEELQGAIGNQAVNRLLANQPTVQAKPQFRGLSHELAIQPKLTIGAVGDKYEQEADRVAASVVRKINAPQNSAIQREEMPEDEELQMKPMVQCLGEGNSIAAPPNLESSINQAKGSGQSIPNAIRQPMENALGADFSGVKVHTDDRANRLNESIHARAFTTGKDIFFKHGEYNPGNRKKQELLAHELTHVMQQHGERMPILQRDVTIVHEEKETTITTEELNEKVSTQLEKNKNWLPDVDTEKLVKNIVEDIEETAQKSGFKSVDELDQWISEKIKKEVYHHDMPHQSTLARGKSFKQIKLAKSYKILIENKIRFWASHTKGVAVLAPIKSLPRMLEKAKGKSEEKKKKNKNKKAPDWADQIGDIKDIMRGSILYKNMEDLYNGAKKIKEALPEEKNVQDATFVISKANELFTNPKEEGGYRDIKIVFVYQIYDKEQNLQRIPVELQLNLAQNVVVKEGKQFSEPLNEIEDKEWFKPEANYQEGDDFKVKEYLEKDIKSRFKNYKGQKSKDVESKINELNKILDGPEKKIEKIPLSHKIYERQQKRQHITEDSIANNIYYLLFDIEEMLATLGKPEDLNLQGFADANPRKPNKK